MSIKVYKNWDNIEDGFSEDEEVTKAYDKERKSLHRRIKKLVKEIGILRIEQHFSNEDESEEGAANESELAKQIEKKFNAYLEAGFRIHEITFRREGYIEDFKDIDFLNDQEYILSSYEKVLTVCDLLKEKSNANGFMIAYFATFCELTLYKAVAKGNRAIDKSKGGARAAEDFKKATLLFDDEEGSLTSLLNSCVDTLKEALKNHYLYLLTAACLSVYFDKEDLKEYIVTPLTMHTIETPIEDYNKAAESFKGRLATFPEPKDPIKDKQAIKEIAKKIDLKTIRSESRLTSFIQAEAEERGLIDG